MPQEINLHLFYYFLNLYGVRRPCAAACFENVTII